MKLTPTEIDEIERAVELLRQYRKDLANNHFSECILHAILLNNFEGHIYGVVDILLEKSPQLGKSVKTQCDELLNTAKMVDDLRGENSSEASLKEIELMGDARRLSIRFQRIAKRIRYLRQQQKAITEISNAQKEHWYKNRTIQGALIGAFALILVSCIGWYIYSNSSESVSIFAEVSKDGTILRSNNFPWKIKKTKDQDGNILYTIVDRRGDSTAISVVPDNPKYNVYQSYDGMVIKFTCDEEKISNFTIKLKY